MEEISLKKALITFKNRLITIIVIVLLVFGAGCAYTFLIKVPLYHSTSSVILVSDSTKSTESLSLGKNLAGSYAEVMKSRKLANRVIDDLHLKMDSNALMGELEVSSSASTGVISVTVSDKDPNQAAAIANKLVEVFRSEIEENYDFTTISIVDTAEPESQPYNMSYVKDMIIYLVAGIVLALGVVFLIFYS